MNAVLIISVCIGLKSKVAIGCPAKLTLGNTSSIKTDNGNGLLIIFISELILYIYLCIINCNTTDNNNQNMKKIARYIIPICLLMMTSSAFADDSCVNDISIPGADNSCQNSLDFSNHINGSPFFVKDPNGLCGIGLSLPGLPDIKFDGIKVNFDLT